MTFSNAEKGTHPAVSIKTSVPSLRRLFARNAAPSACNSGSPPLSVAPPPLAR